MPGLPRFVHGLAGSDYVERRAVAWQGDLALDVIGAMWTMRSQSQGWALGFAEETWERTRQQVPEPAFNRSRMLCRAWAG